MISNDRLDELAALEAAATAGPWRLVEPPEWAEPITEQDRRDDAFRVASRNEFAALIEQCREANRLREENLELRSFTEDAVRKAHYENSCADFETCRNGICGEWHDKWKAVLKGPTP